MMVNEKQFNITLTEKEVDLIVTALHGEYKFKRDLVKKATAENQQERAARINNDALDVARIRDDMGKMINCFFCGEDR